MSTCKCIIQSGPNKGSKCGRKVKNGTVCGIHIKKCVGEPTSSRDNQVITFLRNLIIETDPDLITQKFVDSELHLKFPKQNTDRYRLIWMALFKEKIARINSRPCKKCINSLSALRMQ